MNNKIFREYDIRGIYPIDINESVAYTIGKSYGSYIQQTYNKNICCVGHDNRLSSPSLAKNLINGIIDSGCNVINFGLVTTPLFCFGCKKTNVLIGIMITASHNPKDDNGFKFSFDDLGMARGKQVYDFRDYTLKGEFINGTGKVLEFNPFINYQEYIKNNINMGDRKIKVVLDCGNGTTSLFAKKIYSMFPNLDLTMICDESDGTFPNHHPDPSVLENNKMLIDKVLEIGADIGIGFDGDGDRVGFIKENGELMPIDEAMIAYIRHLDKQFKVHKYLYDVKCGKALEDEIKKIGAEGICFRTGASYTRAEINKLNLDFGGEFSGHLVFNDRWPGIDCGIYNGLRMLEILSNCNLSFSKLTEGINKYYNTPEIKVHVTDEDKFNIVEEVKNYALDKNYKILDIDGVRIMFEDGWALIRASNTGPNLTVRFEGKTTDRLNEIKKEFIDALNQILTNYNLEEIKEQ